jgi:hypothetical protein
MKQQIAWYLACSVSLAFGAAASGCGGDDSSTGTSGGSGGSGGSSTSSTGTAGTGGAAGKGGSAGTGGSSGSSGSGGTAGTGGTTDSGVDAGPVTMRCGTMTCTEIDIGLGAPLPPCCPTGEMNACGVRFGTFCFTTTPGTADPRCPEVAVPMAPMPAPGCCTVTGVCGADLGAPLGCNDLSGLTGGTPIPCGPDAGPPPPRDSGSDSTSPPPDSGPGTDSGGSDTGGGTDSGSGDAPASDGGGSDGGADVSADRAG